jgi:hypothetical protein
MELSGVEEVGFLLPNGQQTISGRNEPRHLCSGIPITFTSYDVEKRAECDVTFTNYTMPRLRPVYQLSR